MSSHGPTLMLYGRVVERLFLYVFPNNSRWNIILQISMRMVSSCYTHIRCRKMHSYGGI